MKRLFISAGETSGDMHAATVVAELKLRDPTLTISGICGSHMQQAGCDPLHGIDELNVMGISEVLRSLSRIRRIERSVLDWCEANRPAVAVLVDFSSFHMRLGRKLRRLGIPVVHFIAPKLWAWGGWRVRKLKHSQDRLACILPFEPSWFQARGIKHAQYVGNPSAISCASGWSAEQLRAHLCIAADAPLLALLPGSRPQEISAHVPVLAESLALLRQQLPDLACVVPVAPGVDEADLAPLWQQGAVALQRTQDDYALRCDAAIAVSGTATLELALWGTPTVLVYKASPLMVFLARRLVRIRCAGLANIILGDKPVMPELIQEHCTSEHILAAVLPLLQGDSAAVKQQQAFVRLRELLGQQQPAEAVAELVLELSSENSP